MADPTLIGGIVAAATSLGGFIRWSAGRMAKSWDNLADVIKANTAMLARNAEALGRVDKATEIVIDRVEDIHDEISGVHTAAHAETHVQAKSSTSSTSSSSRAESFESKTPPAGTKYHFKRPATKPGG